MKHLVKQICLFNTFNYLCKRIVNLNILCLKAHFVFLGLQKKLPFESQRNHLEQLQPPQGSLRGGFVFYNPFSRLRVHPGAPLSAASEPNPASGTKKEDDQKAFWSSSSENQEGNYSVTLVIVAGIAVSVPVHDTPLRLPSAFV